MGLRSGEPRAPGGPWQRLAPMEQMGVRGVRSLWLAPSPNPCVSLLLRIPPGTKSSGFPAAPGPSRGQLRGCCASSLRWGRAEGLQRFLALGSAVSPCALQQRGV